MLREDPAWRERAAAVSDLARDVTEFADGLGLPGAATPSGLTVASHSACSMQHGQGIRTLPQQLLAAAGFVVKPVPAGHLCCGSAGPYTLPPPGIARRPRTRQVRNTAGTAPACTAPGHTRCMPQIHSRNA